MGEREQWLRARDIFEDALQVKPAGRDAFIGTACKDDGDLLREVKWMLEVHEKDKDFMETPIANLREGLPQWALGSPTGNGRFGPYVAITPVGEGGMSTVYLGMRADSEYTKRVCIKLIRSGLESAPIIRRFLTERQILARLEHPNIARLIDGGSTEEGLPYFVMEFVDGQPVDAYCDTHMLGILERLKLFCKICEAVHYAHQNLVIHRDIKPGNVLVGEDGEPKLLDFGIAKLLTPDPLLSPCEPTLTVLRAMTPRYASPEQVRGDVITTTSDVYSLGVLLYELLTGHQPYDVSGLTPEAVRAVCEIDPDKPSITAAREAAAAGLNWESVAVTPRLVALARSTTPGRLRRALAGDLDNIVLKAMRKEPERRYASVEQLAEDLRRHMRGLPVLARPDTFTYRAAKFVHRNRAAALAAALAILSIMGGATAALWQAREARLSEIGALGASAEALLASHRELEALLAAVKAQRKAESTPAVPEDLKTQTSVTLQKVLHLTREANRLEGHSGWVSGVTFSPDGKLLASTSREVILWGEDGQVLRRLSGHRDWVNALAFSPDGKALATASRDKTVKIWDPQSGRLLATLAGHGDGVYGVAFGPNGKFIASSSKDGTARIWKAAGGAPIAILRGHFGTVYGVAFSPDGKTIATAGKDRTVRLWSVADGRQLKLLRAHTEAVRRVVFAPDGKTLISASYDKTARLWSMEGTVLKTFAAHRDAVWGAAYSPDGKSIATGCDDGAIRLWDLDGGLKSTLMGHASGVNGVAFSPDGTALASASADRTVRLWKLQNDLRVQGQKSGGILNVVRFGPQGDIVATAGNDRTIKLYRPDGTWLRTLVGHTDDVRSVAFAPDGKTLASAGDDRTIKLWSIKGQPLKTFEAHAGWISSVAFAPDGKTIATAGNDRTVKLWDPKGLLLNTFRGHTDGVYHLAFAPGGQELASAGYDGTVRLWSLRKGRQVLGFDAGHGPVQALDFSSDGKTLATGGRDGDVRIWKLDGSLLNSFKGHGGGVLAVRFSPDGISLASAGTNGAVDLWGVRGGRPEVLWVVDDPVSGLDFSPVDGTLVSAAGGKLFFWKDREWVFDLSSTACRRLRDYLDTNPGVEVKDRTLCGGA